MSGRLEFVIMYYVLCIIAIWSGASMVEYGVGSFAITVFVFETLLLSRLKGRLQYKVYNIGINALVIQVLYLLLSNAILGADNVTSLLYTFALINILGCIFRVNRYFYTRDFKVTDRVNNLIVGHIINAIIACSTVCVLTINIDIYLWLSAVFISLSIILQCYGLMLSLINARRYA